MSTQKNRIGGCEMSPNPDYRVLVRDVNLKFIWESMDFISLQYHLRMNARGKWVLTLPMESESVKHLLGLLVPGNNGVGGIYVERNGKYLFSGPLLDYEYSFDSDGELIHFIGADEMDFIERTLALAHPRKFQSPYMKNADGYHTDHTPNSLRVDPNSVAQRSSEVFYHIYCLNVGQSADSSRRIPQVYIKWTKGTENDVGHWRYPVGDLNRYPRPSPVITRGDPMMDVLQSITSYSESTVYNPDGSIWMYPDPFLITGQMKYEPGLGSTFNGWWIVFEAKRVEDKTNTIIFSKDQGNVLRLRRTKAAPEANIIQMGGSGEGANRVFAHAADESSRPIYGSREAFREFTGYERSSTDPDHKEELEALKPHLYDELNRAQSQITIEAEVVDVEGMEYHTGWFVGDKVRVETPISKDDVIVREVEGTVTEEGEQIRAAFSTTPAPLHFLKEGKIMSLHDRMIQYLTKRTKGE